MNSLTGSNATSFYQASGTSPTQSEVTATGISDMSEALSALMRVSGFEKNHEPILNACFGYAQGESTFRATHAELGARMTNEEQPFRKNMDDEEARKRNRNLAQKFSRAWDKLKNDQLATGLWFVKMKSGSRGIQGRAELSQFEVDFETVTRTIEIAKKSKEYQGDFRRRAFENAARKLVEKKERCIIDENKPLATIKTPAEKQQDEFLKVRQFEKAAKTYLYKLYKENTSLNIPPDEFNAHLHGTVDKWVSVDFPNRLAAEQTDNGVKVGTVDVAVIESDKQLSEEVESSPSAAVAPILGDRSSLPLIADECIYPEIEREVIQPLLNSDEWIFPDIEQINQKPLLNSDDYLFIKNRYSDVRDGQGSMSHRGGELLETQTRNVDYFPPVIHPNNLLTEPHLDDALTALDVCSSVGIDSFNVIFKDDAANKATYTKSFSLRDVVSNIKTYLERNHRTQESFILDMKSAGRRIIQVDEANAEVMKLLEDVSFMTVETSPSNGQVWLALPENTTDDESLIIKDRLFAVLNSMGANKGASGGLRWVGSLNCKPEYKAEDGSFPLIKLLSYNFNRTVTIDELEVRGLLGEEKPTLELVKIPQEGSSKNQQPKQAPSYEISLASVKRKANGEPDRSAADFLYAVTCFDWGFTQSEAVDLLKSNSEKARARRDNYAENTVRVALQKHRLNPSRKPVQQTKIIFGSRKNLLTEDEYAWRERAAIMEYDGGLSRTEAERLARLESTGQGLLDAA